MSTQQHERVPAWTLGDRLRKAREAAGLEQQEFADELGISRGTISNYEHDKTRVKRPYLVAWAMRTKVPVEWLLTGETGDDANGPQPSPGYDSPFLDQFVA